MSADRKTLSRITMPECAALDGSSPAAVGSTRISALALVEVAGLTKTLFRITRSRTTLDSYHWEASAET